MKKVFAFFVFVVVLGFPTAWYFKYKNIEKAKPLLMQKFSEYGFEVKNLDFKYSGFPFYVVAQLENINCSEPDVIKILKNIDENLLKKNKKEMKELEEFNAKIKDNVKLTVNSISVKLPWYNWNQANFTFDNIKISPKIKQDELAVENVEYVSIGSVKTLVDLNEIKFNDFEMNQLKVNAFILSMDVSDLKITGKRENRKLEMKNFAVNSMFADITIDEMSSIYYELLNEANNLQYIKGINFHIMSTDTSDNESVRIVKKKMLENGEFQINIKILSPKVIISDIVKYFQASTLEKDISNALVVAYEKGVNYTPFLKQIVEHIEQNQYKFKIEGFFNSNLANFDLDAEFNVINELPNFIIKLNRKDDDKLMELYRQAPYSNNPVKKFFIENKNIIVETKKDEIFLNGELVQKMPQVDLAKFPILNEKIFEEYMENFSKGKYRNKVVINNITQGKTDDSSNVVTISGDDALYIAMGYYDDEKYNEASMFFSKAIDSPVKTESCVALYNQGYLFYAGLGWKKDLKLVKNSVQKALSKKCDLRMSHIYKIENESYENWVLETEKEFELMKQ